MDAVFFRNILQAMDGSSMIDGGYKYLLRGSLACFKIAIKPQITASQKLLHFRPPSWSKPMFLFPTIKLIIPFTEGKL
jgi:hypothetical protein